MRLAVIVVHHHTPRLAEESVHAVVADAASTGVETEIIVVDNGSEPEGRRLLLSLPARVVVPDANLGYAGGVNMGVSRTRADWLIAMNADVVVQPGAIGALIAQLEDGADAVGPRLHWDEQLRFVLPPAQPRDLASELLDGLAGRGPRVARRARARWRRHARAHWDASTAIDSHHLSGSVLGMTRTAWNLIGPFDAGYRLYFEETDWLHRLVAAGLVARYEPGSVAVHRYGRSTSREPRSTVWFEESRRRFVRAHHGRLPATLMRLAGRPATARAIEPSRCLSATSPPALERLDSAAAEIEVSSRPCRFPAARERVDPTRARGWRLPADVWNGLQGGTYFVQTLDRHGSELEWWWFRKG